jgi:hypothetical protein
MAIIGGRVLWSHLNVAPVSWNLVQITRSPGCRPPPSFTLRVHQKGAKPRRERTDNDEESWDRSDASCSLCRLPFSLPHRIP